MVLRREDYCVVELEFQDDLIEVISQPRSPQNQRPLLLPLRKVRNKLRQQLQAEVLEAKSRAVEQLAYLNALRPARLRQLNSVFRVEEGKRGGDDTFEVVISNLITRHKRPQHSVRQFVEGHSLHLLELGRAELGDDVGHEQAAILSIAGRQSVCEGGGERGRAGGLVVDHCFGGHTGGGMDIAV